MLSRENELSPPKICKFRKKVNLKKTLCRENDETFSPFQRSKNHFSRLNHQIQSPQIPSYSLHSSSLLLHPLAGALSEFISISSFTSSTVKQWRTHQPLAEYQRFCLIHPRTPPPMSRTLWFRSSISRRREIATCEFSFTKNSDLYSVFMYVRSHCSRFTFGSGLSSVKFSLLR